MALLQIDGCLTVIGQILNNLSDSDLLNLREASPKLENLFSRLQPAYWRKRLYKSYRSGLVDRFLEHTGRFPSKKPRFFPYKLFVCFRNK